LVSRFSKHDIDVSPEELLSIRQRYQQVPVSVRSERQREIMKRIEKLKIDTCNAYLADAKKKTEAAEDAAKNIEETLKPFVLADSLPLADLPLADSMNAIQRCQERVIAVKQAIADASACIEQKLEDSRFLGEDRKEVVGSFTELTDRVKAVSAFLHSFEKNLKDRTNRTKMREAVLKIEELESKLDALGDRAECLERDEGQINELARLVSVGRAFLNARLGEQRGNTENTKTLEMLRERIYNVKTRLSTIRKPMASQDASEHVNFAEFVRHLHSRSSSPVRLQSSPLFR
jgi:Mg2+ and Co2+ transporter CorA